MDEFVHHGHDLNKMRERMSTTWPQINKLRERFFYFVAMISIFFFHVTYIQKYLYVRVNLVNLELYCSNSASPKTPSKLFANHSALGQLTNHNTFRFSEGGPSSNPELIEPFVSGWGESYCNNVHYVKNNVIFEPPSMRACSSTPPKQNQDFVKEHNRTPLMFTLSWE